MDVVQVFELLIVGCLATILFSMYMDIRELRRDVAYLTARNKAKEEEQSDSWRNYVKSDGGGITWIE